MASLKSFSMLRQVHFFISSVPPFLWLPLHLLPLMVPWKIYFDHKCWWNTRANQTTSFLFTTARSGSRDPTRAAIWSWTCVVVLFRSGDLEHSVEALVFECLDSSLQVRRQSPTFTSVLEYGEHHGLEEFHLCVETYIFVLPHCVQT